MLLLRDRDQEYNNPLASFATCLSVLPTLRFFREFGLVFLKTCGLLAFGLVLINICFFWACFFADFCTADCFFSNLAILLFHFTAKRNLGLFLCKFAHFGFVFSDLPYCFCI